MNVLLETGVWGEYPRRMTCPGTLPWFSPCISKASFGHPWLCSPKCVHLPQYKNQTPAGSLSLPPTYPLPHTPTLHPPVLQLQLSVLKVIPARFTIWSRCRPGQYSVRSLKGCPSCFGPISKAVNREREAEGDCNPYSCIQLDSQLNYPTDFTEMC